MDTKIKINLDAIMKDHNKDKDLIAPLDLETKNDSGISLDLEAKNDSEISSDLNNKRDDIISFIKKETGVKQVGISEGEKNKGLNKTKKSIKSLEIEGIKNDENGDEDSLIEEIGGPLKTELVEEVNKPLKTELAENKDIPLETKVIEEKEVVKDENGGEKKFFISLDSIQKNSIDIGDLRIQNENKKKEPISVKQVVNEPKKELFANYEAAFAKKKDSIMQKIQKLKNLPKTRPLFVSSLIIITIIGIGGLFYIDPKTHSLENYKTSIINIIDKNNLINDIGIVNDNGLINEDKQPPPVVYEKEKIQLGGLKFEVETKVVDEKKVFKYDGKTYNSDEELKLDMKVEVEKIKKAKLIDGIIKNFK